MRSVFLHLLERHLRGLVKTHLVEVLEGRILMLLTAAEEGSTLRRLLLKLLLAGVSLMVHRDVDALHRVERIRHTSEQVSIHRRLVVEGSSVAAHKLLQVLDDVAKRLHILILRAIAQIKRNLRLLLLLLLLWLLLVTALLLLLPISLLLLLLHHVR